MLACHWLEAVAASPDEQLVLSLLKHVIEEVEAEDLALNQAVFVACQKGYLPCLKRRYSITLKRNCAPSSFNVDRFHMLRSFLLSRR